MGSLLLKPLGVYTVLCREVYEIVSRGWGGEGKWRGGELGPNYAPRGVRFSWVGRNR